METDIMDGKASKPPIKFTKRKVILVSLITFTLLMLALTAQLSFMTLKYDKIYKGVYVNSINAGGFTTNQLKTLLTKNYEKNVKNMSLLLEAPKFSQTISFTEIQVRYDIDAIVNRAFSIGRSGNIFDKFYDIFNSAQNEINLEISYSYNKNKLTTIINTLYSNTLSNVKNSDLNIKDNRVTIRSGHHGENINMDKLLVDLEAKIRFCKGGSIPVSIIETAPSKINVDDFYSQIEKAPVEASVAIKDNEVIFTSEVVGRSIKKEDLISIANDLENSENKEVILPVNFTYPKITVSDIKAQLFKDVLYSKTTIFKTRNQNEINRSINIRLDTAKINGTILAPGQVFSYNNIVGLKTPEQGYKEAFTYVAGKQVPGLGGGICQVSSTLYNAVLYADLQVLQRRNHMFEVFYVPFGQDATVYYGSTDFQFKNTTKWPLQINCSVTNDNRVIFTLVGTNETPGKTVVVQSNQVGAPIPFPIKYIDDPTVTKEEIVQSGHDGGTFETFKSVLLDGKVISTKKISTSTYKPLEQVIKRVPLTVPVPATTAPVKDPTPTNPDVVP